MADTPMEGLAEWLREHALSTPYSYEVTPFIRWASEVEAARASLPAPTDAEWMKEAERLEVVSAWNDLPDALKAHPGLKRLYRALGGVAARQALEKP